jgi:hypothetical protein
LPLSPERPGLEDGTRDKPEHTVENFRFTTFYGNVSIWQRTPCRDGQTGKHNGKEGKSEKEIGRKEGRKKGWKKGDTGTEEDRRLYREVVTYP